MRAIRNLIALGTAGLLTVSTTLSAPLGNGFTYQGRLNDSGAPANGVFDFVFSLYSSPTNDVPIYSGVLNDNVTVTNGLFTTLIDFGTNLFQGDELWLEVGVRPGDETGDVTLLQPRHRVAAAPYAHYARRAAVADVATSVAQVDWSAIQNVPAPGPGIQLSASNQLGLKFSGSGYSDSAARADHDHFGQEWYGTNNVAGLHAHNIIATGIGIWGRNDGGGSGLRPAGGTGVFGDSTTGPGVTGFSSSGSGVFGWSLAQTGVQDGVKGESRSTTGRGVAGFATATTGSNAGIYGETASTSGTAVRGHASATTGTTYGGRFSNLSPNGQALHATSDRSGVASFNISNRNNSSTALDVRTDGMGIAARLTSGASSNAVPVMQAVHLGHGDGIAATAGGQGNGGHFRLLSDFTNNAAVMATGFGKARALQAVSTSGEAIRAESSGTALYAKSEPDGTALALDGGAIRVKGAGINTPTAVFIHRCTSGNVVASPGGNTITVIDHPMCNGNPNAILFVTPRINLDNFTGYYTYEDFAIAWSATRNRWVLLNTSILDELGDFDVGDSFNVMVVLP
jgi:hypothetical protein